MIDEAVAILKVEPLRQHYGQFSGSFTSAVPAGWLPGWAAAEPCVVHCAVARRGYRGRGNEASSPAIVNLLYDKQ